MKNYTTLICHYHLALFPRLRPKVFLAFTSGSVQADLKCPNLEALTRISAHGPPAATKQAEELAKNALKFTEIKFGERYCTRAWWPNKVSDTIQKKCEM